MQRRDGLLARGAVGFHFSSTWCHSSEANRKPGETVLPAWMRASVIQRQRDELAPSGCSSTTSSSGRP
jgi:hypothetical protein